MNPWRPPKRAVHPAFLGTVVVAAGKTKPKPRAKTIYLVWSNPPRDWADPLLKAFITKRRAREYMSQRRRSDEYGMQYVEIQQVKLELAVGQVVTYER